METAHMELDELKLAWQTLDRRLQQQNALQLQQFRDGRFELMRRHLRPLRWGQVLQLLLGVDVVLFAVWFWTRFHAEPVWLAIGLLMHAYGVVAIIAGSMVQSGIARIDYSAPVLEIQKQLARVRRHYVIGGLWVGLPWWVLWVLVMAMLAKFAGIDLVAHAPGFFWGSVAFGLAGLAGSVWYHRRSQRADRPRPEPSLDDRLAGDSLRKAQAALDEIARFEQE